MKNNQLRQVVFPILAAFIWGTAFVAQDVCADAMGAFTFNGTRYYIAVLSLLVVLAVSSGFRKDRPQISPAEKKAQRRQLCWAASAAVQCWPLPPTSSRQALWPVPTAARPVHHRSVCGAGAGVRPVLPAEGQPAGVDRRGPVRGRSVPAVYQGQLLPGPRRLLVLVCAICFSVHILVIDHFTATCDGVKLSCLQFLFAGTWSTILALFFDTISLQVLLDCIWPLLYVACSPAAWATPCRSCSEGSNPTVVTILLSLESVFAVIAGAVVLHQQMTGREYLAAC